MDGHTHVYLRHRCTRDHPSTMLSVGTPYQRTTSWMDTRPEFVWQSDVRSPIRQAFKSSEAASKILEASILCLR